MTIDLEQIKAGRYSSEEAIQQEIKLVRGRLEKRRGEVAEDRKLLLKKKDAMDKAKAAITLHDAAIATAKNRKLSADTAVKTASLRVEQSKKAAATKAQGELDVCAKNLSLAVQALESLKKDHRKEIDEVERLHAANLVQLKSEETNALNEIDARKRTIDTDLAAKVAQIAKDRDASLRDKGYSTDVLNGLRTRISRLDGQIAEANKLRSEVIQYRDWLDTLWPQRPTHVQDQQTADADSARLKRENEEVLRERKEVTDKKQTAIKEIGEKIDKHERKRIMALGQTRDLVHWPQDQEQYHHDFGLPGCRS